MKVVDESDIWAAIQRDPNRLRKWANKKVVMLKQREMLSPAAEEE